MIRFALVSLALLLQDAPAALNVQEILQQMQAKDQAPTIAGYTCLRRYALENKRYHQKAELNVRMTYTYPGTKKFEVLSEKGSGVIRKKVLHPMVAAEEESSQDDIREHTRITPLNYEFKLTGSTEVQGRPCLILQIDPKVVSKFLMRGRIFVDAEDFAVIRVETVPAQNPSVFIHDTHITQQYVKTGGVWLAQSNRSATESFLFGRTEVTIDSSEYEVTRREIQK
jgi:outer membrane lipoprotein-sorting protein